MSTHRPGVGGLFDSSALCGFSLDDGPLRMHEWDYDCPGCKRLSGEHVDETPVGGVNGGQGDSFPARGADAAPDEPKGASRASATPAPPTVCLTNEDREALLRFGVDPGAIRGVVDQIVARHVAEARAAALNEAADAIEADAKTALAAATHHDFGVIAAISEGKSRAADIARNLASNPPP